MDTKGTLMVKYSIKLRINYSYKFKYLAARTIILKVSHTRESI